MIEAWYGQPGSMVKGHTAQTLAPSKTWVRTLLATMATKAGKYSHTEHDRIQQTRSEIKEVGVIHAGHRRQWNFTYMGADYQIEIRNTS